MIDLNGFTASTLGGEKGQLSRERGEVKGRL